MVNWQDNKNVLIGSTLPYAREEMDIVSRHRKSKRTKSMKPKYLGITDFPIPRIIQLYTKYMRGN